MNRFFFAPSSGAPLAFFRIGIALLGLIQGAWLLGSLSLLYGEDGLVPWSLSRGIVAPYMPTLAWIAPDDTWLGIIMAVYLFSLTALLLGRFTRYMALLAWALHFVFMNTGFMSSYGVETFMHIALCYCIVMPVGGTFSWDALHKPAVYSEWNTLSLRVLQLHVCLVYFASGLEKALGVQWWNGEAIWQTLMQGQFSRFDMHWLANYPLIAKLLCWGTLLTELGYPLLVWWKPARFYAYLAVVGLHLGIAIFMGLELFAGMMIVFSTAAFGWPYLQHAFADKRLLLRASGWATYIDLTLE